MRTLRFAVIALAALALAGCATAAPGSSAPSPTAPAAVTETRTPEPEAVPAQITVSGVGFPLVEVVGLEKERTDYFLPSLVEVTEPDVAGITVLAAF